MAFDVPCQQLRNGTIPVDSDGLNNINRYLSLVFKPKVGISFNGLCTTLGFPGTWGPTGADNQSNDSFGWAVTKTEQYGVANLGYGSSQNLGRSTLGQYMSMIAPTSFPNVVCELQQFTCVGDGNPDGFGTGMSYEGHSWVSSPIVSSLFFGGSNLSVKSGTLNWPLAAGDVAVTGVGFQPDLVMLIWNKHNTLNYEGGINPHAGMSHGFGAASSSAAGQSFATYHRSQGNYFTEGDNNSCFMQNKIAVALNTGASGILASATLVSMDAGGFTLNFSGSADAETQSQSGRLLAYLAMKDTGGGFKVGFSTSKTSTGLQTYTGIGFRPNAVLTAHANVPTTDTNTIRSSHGRGMFASDGSQASMIAGEGLRVSNSHSYSYLAEAVLSFTNAQEPVVSEARYSSMLSDGFELNWVTADATARPWGYVAMKTTGTCECMTLAGDNVAFDKVVFAQ